MNITHLPSDIIREVSRFLCVSDILNFSLSNTQINVGVNDTFWKQYFIERYGVYDGCKYTDTDTAGTNANILMYKKMCIKFSKLSIDEIYIKCAQSKNISLMKKMLASDKIQFNTKYWAFEILQKDHNLDITKEFKDIDPKCTKYYKYLKKNNTIHCESVSKFAARTNNLSLFKWAYRNKNEMCPGYDDFLYSAVCNDKLEFVKWLHANGVDVFSDYYRLVIFRSNSKVFNWLRENTPISKKISSAINENSSTIFELVVPVVALGLLYLYSRKNE